MPDLTVPRRPVIPQAFAPWVDFLEARLEITEVTHVTEDPEGTETRPLAGDERRDMIVSGADGIACRDETITLQDERISTLKSDRDLLRAALQDLASQARQGGVIRLAEIAEKALGGSFAADPDAAITQAWIKGMSDARDTVASITVRAAGIPVAVTQGICVDTLDSVIRKARGA